MRLSTEQIRQDSDADMADEDLPWTWTVRSITSSETIAEGTMQRPIHQGQSRMVQQAAGTPA